MTFFDGFGEFDLYEEDTKKIINAFSENLTKTDNIQNIKRINSEIITKKEEECLDKIIKEKQELTEKLKNQESFKEVEKSLVSYKETLKYSIIDLSINHNINKNNDEVDSISFIESESKSETIIANIQKDGNTTQIIDGLVIEFKNVEQNISQIKSIEVKKTNETDIKLNTLEYELQEIQKGLNEMKSKESEIQKIVEVMNKHQKKSKYNNPSTSITITSINTSISDIITTNNKWFSLKNTIKASITILIIMSSLSLISYIKKKQENINKQKTVKTFL